MARFIREAFAEHGRAYYPSVTDDTGEHAKGCIRCVHKRRNISSAKITRGAHPVRRVWRTVSDSQSPHINRNRSAYLKTSDSNFDLQTGRERRPFFSNRFSDSIARQILLSLSLLSISVSADRSDRLISYRSPYLSTESLSIRGKKNNP